jgi:predicted P-loop ATPase
MSRRRIYSTELPKIVIVENFLSSSYDFSFNVVTGNIEYCEGGNMKMKILDDYRLNSLYRELAKNNIKYPKSNLLDLLKSSFVPKYDPFKEYFSHLLPWDGETDYIQELASTVRTTNDVEWQKCFRKWIVASVACLLDEKISNQTMIVLAGKKGIGKTTWSLNLVPKKLKDYVYSGTIDPDNKDTLIFLSECFLINVDELEILSRKQLGSLKHLITKESVKLRRPYGTAAENLARHASFISSINNNEFLTDLTGSRRFLCFEALDFKYNHGVDMAGVYSQAIALWKSGFQFWFDKEEIDAVNNDNEKFRVRSMEEELLLDRFKPCRKEEATHKLTATEIMALLHEKNRNNINDYNAQKLGKVLTHCGFIKGKIKAASKSTI